MIKHTSIRDLSTLSAKTHSENKTKILKSVFNLTVWTLHTYRKGSLLQNMSKTELLDIHIATRIYSENSLDNAWYFQDVSIQL